MDIIEANRSYERWMNEYVQTVRSDLVYKHRLMAHPKNPFPFFRATFFRWLQIWPKICPELAKAPTCHAIGDVHIENFGTWRDSDGRLCWGMNDFDEADLYPFTIDLVRLAASVGLAHSIKSIKRSLPKACAAIELGYRNNLERGGRPMVLEEKNRHLRRLAFHQAREPNRYWKKMSRLLELEPIRPPSELKKLLRSMAPKHLKEVQFRRRPQVGMGSLGRPRYIMLAQWDGAWIAREAKAIVPPAKYWLNEKDPPEGTLPAQKILEKSIRCPDPFLHYGRHWVNRRLAPHCGRIELTQLVGHDAEIRLLAAMGQELANVHLGSGKETAAISHYLGRLPKDWLVTAAEEMLRILIGDWRIYGEKVRKKVPPSAAE